MSFAPVVEEPAATAAAEPIEQGTSLWKDAWHRLAKNKLAVSGAILLILITAASFLGPILISQSYETQNLRSRRHATER